MRYDTRPTSQPRSCLPLLVDLRQGPSDSGVAIGHHYTLTESTRYSMPRKLSVCCVSLALSLCSLPLLSQQQASTHPKLTLRNAQPIRHGADRASVASALEQSRATNTLPTWNYQVISTRDGNIYTGTIVGANPTARGND